MSHRFGLIGVVNAFDLLARIAVAQHGLVTRRQALAGGVGPSTIDRWIRSGRLVVVHPSVYRLACVPDSFEGRLLASCLAVGKQAVVSHRSAAALWGVESEQRLELSVVGSEAAPRGTLVHRVAQLDTVDVTERCGLPVTRPARTIVDLAGVLTPAALEAVLDDNLSRRLVTCDYLSRRLDELGRAGRKGTGVLAQLLAARPDGRFRAQTKFERRVLALLDAAGIEGAVPQYEVRLPSGRKVYLDVALPADLLALEAESYQYHSSRTAWSKDHVRNRELVALGWRILPVTWFDLDEAPQSVLTLIESARRARRARGSER
ncbi:MAG: type IV toxin-antitoxin system AbiEi family antitoxin domain-containing protein, partial [Actinomycetota bacterium]|nr:type IV toxin-antitoxin system AbiEi family antitoxin domain-containing protein [Actinomycetota bacterium]